MAMPTGRAAKSAGSRGDSRGKYHALVEGFVDEVACDTSLPVDVDTVRPERNVPDELRCKLKGCVGAWDRSGERP